MLKSKCHTILDADWIMTTGQHEKIIDISRY